MPEELENILLSNPALQLCFGKIALDGRHRLSVFLNKNNGRGAAAERFNSKGSAASKKIKDTRSNDSVAQTGEDSSFDAVHRRSHTALRNCQADSAGTAGDHSHGDGAGVGVALTSGSTSCGKGEVDGAAGIAFPASAGCGAAGSTSSSRFFFFFPRSFFPPPKKLLIILLRSRPTNLSIRLVLGLSMVPPT